jgi:hypothetical protein
MLICPEHRALASVLLLADEDLEIGWIGELEERI